MFSSMYASPIYSAEEIKRIDRATCEILGISDLELMKLAGRTLADKLEALIERGHPTSVVCGKGNNGGDGLVLASHLREKGFAVKIYIVQHSGSGSESFNLVLKELKEEGRIELKEVQNRKDLPDRGTVIDALMGSGINRPLSGLMLDVVDALNHSGLRIISIDVPSGMPVIPFADGAGKMIHASETLTIQHHKAAFLMPDYGRNVGELTIVDIGLVTGDKAGIKEQHLGVFSWEEATAGLIKRQKFDTKHDFGHALLVCGSERMMGAAVLAARGAIRSGCGLLSTSVPACGIEILQVSVPEAILETSVGLKHHEELRFGRAYDAIGIGPGLGRHEATTMAIVGFIGTTSLPMVLDADALNAISAVGYREVFKAHHRLKLILTPHEKEFDRMFGPHHDRWSRIQTAIPVCAEFGITLVLKGAYTAIIAPDGSVTFNSSGSSALAKGGSGDILTGLMTGLLARGYDTVFAARLACLIHGKAGELAEQKEHGESVTASDVAACIGPAFKWLTSFKGKA